MYKVFQEVYNAIDFINQTDLEIEINTLTIQNTANLKENSDVTVILSNNQKKIKKDGATQYIIAIDKNFKIFVEDEKLVKIILNILFNNEDCPIPFSNFIEYFNNKTHKLINKNDIKNLDRLWIHIQSDNLYKAQENFNLICDEIDTYNKNIEIYFSYIYNENNENIYFIGNNIEK